MSSTGTSKKIPLSPSTSKIKHQAFSWYSKEAEGYPLSDFFACTKEIADGIQLCLELIDASALDREAQGEGDDVLPTLSRGDSSRLMRFARAASELLGNEAERTIGWINEYGAKQIKSGKGGL